MNIKNLFNKIIQPNFKSSKLNEEEDVMNTPGLLSNEYQKKLALITELVNLTYLTLHFQKKYLY